MSPFLQFSVLKESIIEQELLWIHYSKKKAADEEIGTPTAKSYMYPKPALLAIPQPPHKRSKVSHETT